MLFLLLQAVMDQIRTFVAKRDMSRLRAFLGLFYSDLTQTYEIQLRFDSDIWIKKRWLEPLRDPWNSCQEMLSHIRIDDLFLPCIKNCTNAQPFPSHQCHFL